MMGKEKLSNPLWKEFDFAEQNPDQSGGVLYALRYDEERLKAGREKIVSAIEGLGATPQDIGKDIKVSIGEETNEKKMATLVTLLEELSVINEAMAYKEAGFRGIRSIQEWKKTLVGYYFELFKKRDLVAAYDLVTISIPEIIRILGISHIQNKTLSRRDLQALEELQNFCVRQDDNLNRPGGMLVLG
jgi:hypothetical protein